MLTHRVFTSTGISAVPDGLVANWMPLWVIQGGSPASPPKSPGDVVGDALLPVGVKAPLS